MYTENEKIQKYILETPKTIVKNKTFVDCLRGNHGNNKPNTDYHVM